MARNDPGAPPLHVVVLAYGPASATGAAVRHARSIVGENDTVETVAATRAGQEFVSHDGATPVDGWGLSALRTVTDRYASELVLLIHDDVTLSRRGVEALTDAALRHRRPAVPWTNDAGVDARIDVRRPRHPGELDQYAGSISERLIAGHIGFSCIVATGTQLSGPIDHLVHIPGVRLNGIPAVAGQAVAHHARRCLEQIPEPEGPDGRPLLVANLIVRDEADNIEACIASLDGFVDRVEVVDTGSTDDTVALARAAGARVHEVQWRDDFGWARNQVLDRSRDAWFAFWIDADERLTANNPDYFRRILASIAGDIEGLTIQIHNRDAAGAITSSFYANRIYSTDGTRFTGALHERVLSKDGTDLHAVEAGSVKLDHYGYADDVVDAKEKYIRNLDIAKRDYEREPNPRHAFEYARALGLGEGDPRLRATLLAEAVLGDLDTPGRANVYAALAHALIDAGDYEAAIEAARSALDLVPGDDLAGAALAKAASEIGDYDTVISVTARRTEDGPRPLFQIKGNHVVIDSLVAAALIRKGRADEALDRLRRHLSEPAAIGWRAIAEAAAATTDPVRALSAIVRADRSGMAVAAAAETCAPLATARLAAERVDAGSPAQQTVSIGLLAATVAGDRDLLEGLLTGRSALAPDVAAAVAGRMRARGFADLAAVLDQPAPTGPSTGTDQDAVLAGLIGEDDTVLDLRSDPEPADGARHDVVVIGPLTDPAILARAKAWVDPAGIVVLWDPPVAPASILHIGAGAPAPSTGPSRLSEDLLAAGYRPGSVDGLQVARPELDEGLVEAVIAAQGLDAAAPSHDLGIVTIGEVGDEELLWARASVPGRIRIAQLGSIPSTDALADLDTRGVATVLVIPAGTVCEPDWVATLLGHGGPAGIGLLDAAGAIRHAGAAPDGRAVATGSRSVAHPLVLADRHDTPLLAPFVCPAGELTATPHGIHFGGHFARSTGGGETGPDPADLAATLAGRTVVALAAGLATLSDDLRTTVDLLVADRPVVVCAVPLDPGERDELRRLGCVVLDGSVTAMSAVAAAARPERFVYLGTAAFDGLFGAAAAGAPAATHIAVEYHGLQADLADAVLSAPASVEALLTMQPPSPPTPRVAEIPAPSERLAGTVSVVIPVWNNWELTEACLASLDEHGEAPLEIIIVDNGSTDDTAPELAGRPDLTVITNETNLGFPTAVNQGLAAARGEFVCVLNNDTVVTAGWLTEMLKVLDVPGTGMVGPRSNQISGLQTVPDAPALADRPAAERWARRFVRGREGGHWLINRLVGFCLLARRELFEEVGGFDEGFGIGNYEDDELSARVRAAGYTLRVADGSVVLHHGGATFSKLGLDYASLMVKAGRHFGGRAANPSGLLSAIILSDGDHSGVAATARSLLPIADRIRVVERRGFAITEIESGALRTAGVEFVARDWQDPAGAAASLSGLDDHLLLICEAGEIVDVGDWGAARAALEAAPAGPVEIRGPSGFEVRLDRPEPDAVARFGSSSDVRMTEIQIRAPR